jgi:hypothetical protein
LITFLHLRGSISSRKGIPMLRDGGGNLWINGRVGRLPGEDYVLQMGMMVKKQPRKVSKVLLWLILERYHYIKIHLIICRFLLNIKTAVEQIPETNKGFTTKLSQNFWLCSAFSNMKWVKNCFCKRNRQNTLKQSQLKSLTSVSLKRVKIKGVTRKSGAVEYRKNCRSHWILFHQNFCRL